MTLRIQARKTVQTACSPNVELRPRSDCLPAYSPFRTSQVKGQIKILPAAAMHAQGHQKKTADGESPHGQLLRLMSDTWGKPGL